MVYIPALNTAKVVLEQLFGSQQLANILYFTAGGGFDETSLTALAEAVRDWWDVEMQPLFNSALSLVGVTATDIETATGSSVTVPVSPALAGARDGAAAPTNVAGVVTFRTIGRGRSARGRNYVGGVDTDSIQNVTDLTAGWVAEVLAAYDALSDVEASEGVQHVVASFYTNKAPRTVALLQPVTAYTMDVMIDSQRRRLRGRGV